MKTNGQNFSDLLKERCGHGSVSMGNTLFVIGRYTSEVFDSITNKFMNLKSLPKIKDNYYYPMGIHAVVIGYKIYVFQDIKEQINVEKENVKSKCFIMMLKKMLGCQVVF